MTIVGMGFVFKVSSTDFCESTEVRGIGPNIISLLTREAVSFSLSAVTGFGAGFTNSL